MPPALTASSSAFHLRPLHHRSTRSFPGARVIAAALAFGIVFALCGCAPPAPRFSLPNARAHVAMLATTIGSRPVGTEANRRAREYVVDQLRLYGFEVRVQEADAVRRQSGVTAHVNNVIAVKAGEVPDAVALVAHYDSAPESPGAADDGLGVAVALEAGRVLAARPRPRYSLVVALTDGEEVGLMGAEALVVEPIMQRIRAYLNFEAIGTTGPSLLFETGPGNAWLVNAWAAGSPYPVGASFSTEIYRRLPNNTDFSVLKRAGVPGLNFAPIGNSYVYHTSRDTAEALDDLTLRQTGENAVATVESLDSTDITQRSDLQAVHFDVLGMRAVVFGRATATWLLIVALVLGTASWIRLLVVAWRRTGLSRLILTFAWAIVGLVVGAGAMWVAAWGLRASREVYHPWYAHPDRFFALLVVAGLVGAWAIVRVGLALPNRLRGCATPTCVWAVTMPTWIALGVAARSVPAASYLVSLPLVAAAAALLACPTGRPFAQRIASVVVLAVTGTLWVPTAVDLLHLAVPVFGRLPLVTPINVFPGFVLIAAAVVAPPFIAIVSGWAHRAVPPAITAAALLLALAVAAGLAYVAPAYTHDRPLVRVARYLEDLRGARSYWEVAGKEPGLDLAAGAPPMHDWQRATGEAPLSVRLGQAEGPFLFRARTATSVEPPVDVRATFDAAVTGRFEVFVRPREPGLTVTLVMPRGVVPLEANLAAVVVDRIWRASYIAPPPDGVAFRGRLALADRAALGSASVVVGSPTLPGAGPGRHVPGWLPQERTAWSTRAIYIVPVVAAPAGTGPVAAGEGR